jgi:hypothetical protein
LNLTFPEGVAPDEKLLSAFKPLAKEFGLDSPKAQKLVDLYVGQMKASVDAQNAAWVEQQKKWGEEVKADKELGGAQFDATKQKLKAVFDSFDKDGAIRKAIHELGLSNHPALVRLAVRVHAAIGEDSVAARTANAPSAPDADAVMRARYPTMYPKE